MFLAGHVAHLWGGRGGGRGGQRRDSAGQWSPSGPVECSPLPSCRGSPCPWAGIPGSFGGLSAAGPGCSAPSRAEAELGGHGRQPRAPALRSPPALLRGALLLRPSAALALSCRGLLPVAHSPFPVLGYRVQPLWRGCQALRRPCLFSGALSQPWLVLGGGVTGLPGRTLLVCASVMCNSGLSASVLA